MHEAFRIVVGQPLEGVPEGVAKVKERSLALLGFVGDDHARLGRAAPRDRFDARGAAGEDFAPFGFQEFEEIPVADEPVFDHLGVSCAKLALAQAIEAARISENQRRLMEGADEVLAMAGIDAPLAAHPLIALPTTARRDLNPLAPPCPA